MKKQNLNAMKLAEMKYLDPWGSEFVSTKSKNFSQKL
jgi:hypothetical protein